MTTSVQDPSFPLFPPKTTEHRLRHFDETAFRVDPSSAIFAFVDALAGDAGVATLKKESFMMRLEDALGSIAFSDLDYIFGSIGILARSPSESYPWDPMNDMLTSDQWDEVRVKDSWYRDRIRKFFLACALGGTPDGLRALTESITSASCDVYEVWRLLDNFGLSDDAQLGSGLLQLGRAGRSRQEVVISPHKKDLSGSEQRMLRQVLKRIAPVDAIVTVNPKGVAMRTPVPVATAAADSTYFQVEKEIVAGPDFAEIAKIEPEFLPVDLLPSERWILNPGKNVAPYRAYNIGQESGYYYLASGGRRSPIESVTYGTRSTGGGYAEVYLPQYGGSGSTAEWEREKNFESARVSDSFTKWTPYPKADSPDNFPGGKYGITPDAEPALFPDRTEYQFPYQSQADYVRVMRAAVVASGGEASATEYRLPMTLEQQTRVVYEPIQAIADVAPAKGSTVSSPWTGGKQPVQAAEKRDLSTFLKRLFNLG